MSKKKVQIPFSIDAWNKSNTRVETKNGRSVRILCTDLDSEYPIVAAVKCNDGSEYISAFDAEGHFCKGHLIDGDLIIVEETEVEEPERWADNKDVIGEGWFLNSVSEINCIRCQLNNKHNSRLFASEKLAKSARAMARISQLLTNDKRYGGLITNEEWSCEYPKFAIINSTNKIKVVELTHWYSLLAFHTEEQCILFLNENKQLIKDYLMID